MQGATSGVRLFPDNKNSKSGGGVCVTVLMPAFNAENYIEEAIESVLQQTLNDLELLIVNDGSTDDTGKLVRNFSDPRIRVVDTRNRGVAAALNLGFRLSKGDYVARMDADDVCIRDRFTQQMEILDRYPDVVLVHGGADYVDEHGDIILRKHDDVVGGTIAGWRLLWANPIIHPTVMLRKDVAMRGRINYQPSLDGAEDFDFWSKISKLGRVYGLKNPLINRRVHRHSISSTSEATKQAHAIARVIKDNLQSLEIHVGMEKAIELAYISGATKIHPGTYEYKHLRNPNSLLNEALYKYREGLSGNMNTPGLTREVNIQKLLWAKYIAYSSRKLAYELVVNSIGFTMNSASIEGILKSILAAATPRPILRRYWLRRVKTDPFFATLAVNCVQNRRT